ncbi:hypothetical protein PL371_15605 [Tenacibaculum maritimum]|nr:hypothetical protein [Tenacibaculum maritimum]MDB0613258.1 hypothetical protein [Tenacibaculum maritimum]
MRKKLDVNSENTFDKEAPKHGYYLQINHQNCHYEVRVNDEEAYQYRDRYPVMSIRVPINSEYTKKWGTEFVHTCISNKRGFFK